MGLAKNFNKAIHRELTAYAAWFPIVNTFKVGDYGYFKDGVFQSLGNIKDKYSDIDVPVDTGQAALKKVDFTSDGTRTLKFDASGNAIDTFAGLGDAKASLKLVFERADSCMIKAEKLTIVQMKSIDAVATALANKDGWRNKFCVVSATYTAEDCAVICSREAGTEVEISAGADVLQQVEAGKVSGGFQFKSTRDSVFKAIGETGILALRLFKLNIFNKVKVMNLSKDQDFKIEELSGDDINDDLII